MTTNPYEPATITTINLDVIQVAVKNRLADITFLERPELRVYQEELGRAIAIELRAYVLGLKQTPLKIPKTPWQHFKQVYAPKWFLKRFPVLYTMIDVTVLYPHPKACLPKFFGQPTIRVTCYDN